MLVGRAFQTEGEALGKIIRAKQTSCQLSTYFVGRVAFYRLRQQIQREMGERFDLERLSRSRALPRHDSGEVSARARARIAGVAEASSREDRRPGLSSNVLRLQPSVLVRLSVVLKQPIDPHFERSGQLEGQQQRGRVTCPNRVR